MRHVHRKQGESKIFGWSHCVARPSAGCNGASHGAITYRDECRCGAFRLTESNGRYEERGDWIEP